MGIRQELISFINHIDTVDAGYKSWGKVTVSKIAIRDGQNFYSTSTLETSISEKDIVALSNNNEDKMIAAIFAKRSKINCIIITQQECASTLREEVPPILDDQAQLLGVSVRVADVSNKQTSAKKIVWALSSRFAAVCSDGRCICVGGTVDDAYIAAQLLEKTSKAWIEAKWLGGAKSINRFEAWAMQMYFQFKYAKEAKRNK